MKKILIVLIICISPFLLFSKDTLPNSNLEKAIRIEYDLVIPNFDPLINYSSLPLKKILTIHKGEAVLENLLGKYKKDWKVYYDLDFNFYYYGFEANQITGVKWIKWGRAMAVSKQAAQTVLGKPCKAMQIKYLNDTLLVLASNEFGVDFYEMGEIEGLALEYEIPFGGIGKVKYRASKMDTVLLADGRLAYINSDYIMNGRVNSKKITRLNKSYQRWLERTREKMIGSRAPRFKVWDMEGNAVRRKDFKGKIMVLHFWNESPLEIPYLNKVVKKYNESRDIVFISLASCSERWLESVLKKYPFDYTVCPAPYWVAQRYKVPAIMPLHVVVDQKGKVQEYLFGSHPDIAKKMMAAIDGL